MSNNLYTKSIESLKKKGIFLREKYIEKIKKYSDSMNILILEWQRRVWKSYSLIWFLNFYKIDIEKVFYINKELDINDEICNQKDLNVLFEKYKKLKNIEYIIIDEIQNIESWEKFILAKFSEKKYKIIITWSNSKLLSWELSTLLTGRYLSIEIFSFDFKEFLSFKKLDKNLESFKNYITFGGMPEVLLLDWDDLKRNYIKNTLNSIFFKDIVSRFTIRNTKLLEKIFQYLQWELWNIVSITNIWNYIKNIFRKEVSLTTISNYLNYLVFPFLVYEVSRYDIKWKKILDYMSKYYFADIWIRNSSWFNFVTDIGKILENLVFIKLLSDWYNVSVWELQWKEIDFIAEKNWEIIYVQVCYLLSSDSVINREFWNLLEIKDNYEKFVVSMDESFWNTYKWIKNINILDFITN